MMRFSSFLRLSPLAEAGPTSLVQWALAATPWALVAILALAMLSR